MLNGSRESGSTTATGSWITLSAMMVSSAEIERVSDGRRVSVNADFLVGADGPRSMVRRSLGISYGGMTGAQRDFMGGRMLAVYLRSPDFYAIVPHPKAWMYNCFNRDRRAFMASVNGRDEFAFHTQLRPGEDESAITIHEARAAFQRACGAPIDCEVLSFLTWTAGHALVADGMQRGRVFLGGDAAHLFTPTGGLGYNTAIEDAVNLGWKLANVVKGIAQRHFSTATSVERRPVALRNTEYARRFAARSASTRPRRKSRMTPKRAAKRGARQALISTNMPATNSISPASLSAGDTMVHQSSSRMAAAHRPTPQTSTSQAPAPAVARRMRGLRMACPCTICSVSNGRCSNSTTPYPTEPVGRDGPRARRRSEGRHIAGQLRDLYEADLALIRPDQIVAWRGSAAQAGALGRVLARALGHATNDHARLAN